MGLLKLLPLFLLIALLQTCFAPPVTQTKKENEEHKDSEYGDLESYLEYHRYLKEVVNALESDGDFRQKLEKADENEIKSGKIAEELQFVSHHVRSRLDELKRIELQRLRALTEKKIKLEQSNSIDEDPTHHHLDQANPHTFEIEDLKKLISKTTEDLAEADKVRKEEFKQYELEKEYQKRESLNHTFGAEREKLEKQFQEIEKKHQTHEKLHEPGHKAQLEEVWEEQDQMQQEFDPKMFFMLHDVDGNGLWDQDEVKALFIKELDKMYQQGAVEDDMRERLEDMERMRESVFKEMDYNRNGFIEYWEFLQQTNSNDFKQDHGWQGLDEQTKPYTDEELSEYIKHHRVNQIPPYGQGHPQYPQQGIPPGGYQQAPPGGYQQVPPGAYQQAPPNQQFHPGQVPQMPPQPIDLNTNEIHPDQPQPPQYRQVPQQQYANHPPAVQQQNVPQPQQAQPKYQQPQQAQPQYQQPPQAQPQYQKQPQVPQPQQPNNPAQQQNNEQPRHQPPIVPQQQQNQPNQGQQQAAPNQHNTGQVAGQQQPRVQQIN